MPNIMDYMDWRGDITFKMRGFNEIDAMIFSYLSYVNMDNIAPMLGQRAMSIQTVCEKFFALHSEEELRADKSLIRSAPYVMKKMVETERYGSLKIKNYVNNIDISRNLQLAAMEIVIDRNTSFLAFRGTDDNIVGWKEDFFLSKEEVEAQRQSISFLDFICSQLTEHKKFYIGGHSKGGNLAVYSAAYCDSQIRERIEKIYDFDGPGFKQEFLDSVECEEILPKVIRIIPENSIIGMLLFHRVNPAIVKSSASGIMQHDMMSWEIHGNQLIYGEELTKQAQLMDETMDHWLANMKDCDREKFITEVFSVIESTGCKTLTELYDGGLKSLQTMIKKRSELSKDSRAKIDKLIQCYFGGLADRIIRKIPGRKRNEVI